MPTIMPGAIWKPVVNHSGTMTAHRGAVMHVQVGNNSCYGIFNTPSFQASSTLWISKAGIIEQYVDYDEVAWTQAGGNEEWNGWEFEGLPSERLTEQQVIAGAHAYAFGVKHYGWKLQTTNDPSGEGFGWHGMGGAAWGGHFDCPGDLRKPQRQDILNIAHRFLQAPATPVVAPRKPPLPVLTVGARGPAVTLLQEHLHVVVTGIFGPQERRAVIMFQHVHGLSEDGIVGPRTWAALGL